MAVYLQQQTYRKNLTEFAFLIISIFLLLFAVWEFTTLEDSFWGRDYSLYMRNTQRFFDTGTPYSPEQLAGQKSIFGEIMLYPPNALLLFIPFKFLPVILWWVIPASIVAYMLYRWQPRAWSWPLLAFAILWPRSIGAIAAGNTDLWSSAVIALGLEWGWPALLILIKPSFFPLALIGLYHKKGLVIAGVIFVVVSLLFLPLWFQYLVVLRSTEAGVSYSILSIPIILAPIVAYIARRSDADNEDCDC